MVQLLRDSTVPKGQTFLTWVLGIRVAQCIEAANRIEELHPQDLCQGEVLAKKPWVIVFLKNWPKFNYKSNEQITILFTIPRNTHRRICRICRALKKKSNASQTPTNLTGRAPEVQRNGWQWPWPHHFASVVEPTTRPQVAYTLHDDARTKHLNRHNVEECYRNMSRAVKGKSEQILYSR